jgi:phosphomannomutase/phosphoglucomutase
MYDDIEERGGRAVMWKTGHSLIKAKMKAEKALLAGEMSGHFFFADRYFGYDDALYATLRLVEIIKKSSLSLKKLLSDLPETHVTPEIRIECPDQLKCDVVNKVKENFEQYLKGRQTIDLPDRMTVKQLITVDGVRIALSRGWALLRASNTQPVLVLRFEADTEAELIKIRNFFEKEVAKALEKVRR